MITVRRNYKKMPPKKAVKDDDLCASGLTDHTERKIMATAMKQGEDQIDILRESRTQEPEEESQQDQEDEE